MVHKIVVHGDDLIIVTNEKLDVRRFTDFVAKFGMTLNFDEEGSSENGERIRFLGSLWKDGLPERNVAVMIMSACTTRSEQPKMDSIDEFVKGRIFTIFGFDWRIYQFGQRLGNLFLPGDTINVLVDGLDWEHRSRAIKQGLQYIKITAGREP